MGEKTPQNENGNNTKNNKTTANAARGKARAAEAICEGAAPSGVVPEERPVFHIGLDVHAADFTACIAEPGRGEVREVGTFWAPLCLQWEAESGIDELEPDSVGEP